MILKIFDKDDSQSACVFEVALIHSKTTIEISECPLSLLKCDEGFLNWGDSCTTLNLYLYDFVRHRD